MRARAWDWKGHEPDPPRSRRPWDGRAGRDLGNGDVGAVFFGDGRHARADAFRDVVALGGALVLREEVDLDVGHRGTAAQEVVADEAVEIEGRGRARVGLQVGDFGLCGQKSTQLLQRGGGVFQRRASGHVHHHLKLRLVIKWQHLEHDQTRGRQDQ